MALDQPADGALRGTLADADVFSQLSITDLYLGTSLFGLGGQPKIDEKAGWAAIVADEVAHKNVDEVRVDLEHDCISQYYSDVEAIALPVSPF